MLEASTTRHALDGVELAIRPDAGKVVLAVYMTGALAGLSRKVIIPANLAETLGDNLLSAARQARELAP
jgi:hypothetical protein